MEVIKIPLTPDMKKDYGECQTMFADGEEKDCSKCSCDGGGKFGCMGEYKWSREGGRRQYV